MGGLDSVTAQSGDEKVRMLEILSIRLHCDRNLISALRGWVVWRSVPFFFFF